ncbi:MAG: ribonuclease HII [Chromatiaceae bacterium]|nr:ribonuclease HII [Gammaproteobacteria bacterium]MCB1873267.1 ribonuclease HII [Gammaproteobacteria bacterium]MCP5428205.1 ribonuclease HII [Chromatiaceae bacterium]MCP5448725.1 ribonuclease HII [Chromatiaceae bacterium]
MTPTFPLLTAGVDEVGRGPLAGPVIAAAVILDPDNPIAGIGDSKKLSDRRRQLLSVLIRKQAIAWAVGRAEAEEIDRLNILQASLLAMRRAVAALPIAAQHVMVDGNYCPELGCSVEAVVGGDASVAAIGAASIVAKVVRDREMIALDSRYPGYGFARHKGYPTRLHLEALSRLGVSEIHRRSFAPVKRLLQI